MGRPTNPCSAIHRPGGTGKTKLLRHWLDHTANIEALIAWSFYSQGSSEDKQVSATPFFTHAFKVLHSDKTTFSTEEEKGEHLAHLLRQRRCLLVLDGLEPLQHAGRGMRGELKDRAIRQLLKSLAGNHTSLCIITTRLAVHELSDRAHTVSHDLQNLALEDGVRLLQSWQVHGNEAELAKAVQEYGCHALALHLLGLFDHPIETEVLQVLWQAQIPDLLDCHPLIREYFGKQLLEMARLLVAEAAGFDSAQPTDSDTTRCLSGVEGNMEQIRTHVEAAAKLIEATGYHRRDAELAELQQHLG